MADDPYQSRQYREALRTLPPETRQQMLRGEFKPVTMREATMPDLEYCCVCDNPTGRAGIGEDSLYFGDDGPFCEDCYEDGLAEGRDPNG